MLNEQDTKDIFVGPVLDALGWKRTDHRSVRREYRRDPADNPVDYALLVDGVVRLLVETKRCGADLRDYRWTKQVISYAAVAGVEWAVLTNGIEWHVYYALLARTPVERRLFRAIRIDDADAVAMFNLLSRQSVVDQRLDAAWRCWAADRLAREAYLRALDNLVQDLAACRSLVPDGEGVTDADLEKALVRVRSSVSFEGGAPGLVEKPGVPVPAPRAEPAELDSAHPMLPPKALARGERVEVADLLREGRLRPGATLTARYRKQTVTAEVGEGGTVLYGGQVYSSVSDAAVAAKRDIKPTLTGKSANQNGWTFWSAEDLVVGDTTRLRVLRERAEARQGHSTP